MDRKFRVISRQNSQGIRLQRVSRKQALPETVDTDRFSEISFIPLSHGAPARNAMRTIRTGSRQTLQPAAEEAFDQAGAPSKIPGKVTLKHGVINLDVKSPFIFGALGYAADCFSGGQQ
ncbi:MAG TPA: hypothetical protein VGG45_00520 [Terracidiphilus sp.]|jgi:hypothetical protein